MSEDLVLGATALDPQIRAAAIKALGEQRRVDGVQALIFALATAEPATADLAVTALVQIGPPAVGPLRVALEHDVDDLVRARLQNALTRLSQGVENL
ncbi:MAG TPA: HEAT repeat domain-containing protein [Anaerolineales bacterium]|nr:HEAT repeat domain-containing protein [Anaerolineales bacterium]HRF49428.1 HEAT repeat domain-containing protein [Anaerolineales bacterium]